MGLEIMFGVMGGLLLASLGGNLALWIIRNQLAEAWRNRALQAEDRAHAAELRRVESIDALLDRIRTSDRLEVVAPAPSKVDPDAVRYSPDTAGDFDWNEFQGEAEAAALKDGETVT